LQVFFSQNISKSNLSSPKSLVAVTLFQFFTSTASFKVVHLTEHSLGTLCSFFYFFLFYARSSQKVLFFFPVSKLFLHDEEKKTDKLPFPLSQRQQCFSEKTTTSFWCCSYWRQKIVASEFVPKLEKIRQTFYKAIIPASQYVQ